MIGIGESYDLVGRRVVVTGASSGIGAAFADELSRRGANLVLVARALDTLESLAELLRARDGVSVEVLGADLSDTAARSRLAGELVTRSIDVLVNNAGAGSHGPFAELDAKREVGLVELNCAAVVELTRALLPGMLERKGGGVINVASTVGFQPTPSMATYGATKAFVLSHSLALREECRGTGVRVLAFCPGPVATNFGASTGDVGFASGSLYVRAPLPDRVVPGALNAFVAGRALYVPGASNRVVAFSSRLAPRPFTARVTGMILGMRHGR